MSFSNYLEDALLNSTLRTTPVYVGLFTSDPGEASGGTEVSGGSYARVAATFAAPSGGACANDAVITVGPSTADWGLITHVVIFDSLSGGNRLYVGTATNKTLYGGDSYQFAIGQLVVALD